MDDSRWVIASNKETSKTLGISFATVLVRQGGYALFASFWFGKFCFRKVFPLPTFGLANFAFASVCFANFWLVPRGASANH